jgi:hypothetical protein
MDDQTMFDLFDSLKREVRQEIQPVRDALERIEARLARQGGLIQGGARQVARLATWSEDIDQLLAERDQRIEDLSRRVEKLEGK